MVLGTKKGYLGSDLPAHPRLHILADKVNAQSLFPHFDKVYVVTSQLGFEALWHRKEVICFGVPFYSGWGLTDDRIKCSRRKQAHTIESLFAAACLKYTRYIDPETGERCELEDIIELIALQRSYQKNEVDTLYAVGFSLWKRAFLKDFVGDLARSVRFIGSCKKVTDVGKPGDGVLIWGAKEHDYIPPAGVKLFRVEDGFIRSSGLGAELKRPGSLVIDQSGIYFDSTRTSDLEQSLNTVTLSEEQKRAGHKLQKLLVQQRVSKYNLKGNVQPYFSEANKGQLKILVTGQVDSDASIKWGSLDVKSNLELLKQVREYAPSAYILYKPHPDVLLAGRSGHIPEEEARQYADKIVSKGDIFECIRQCDELHVMTSLAGFEALIQGKKVHTWGTPFYSNWGLTVDHQSCERRSLQRTVDEVVYLAYCRYPRYINWHTRRFTTPERMINSLVAERESVNSEESRLKRWFSIKGRKLGYLCEALSK